MAIKDIMKKQMAEQETPVSPEEYGAEDPGSEGSPVNNQVTPANAFQETDSEEDEPDEYAENHEEIAKLKAAQEAARNDDDKNKTLYIPKEHIGELPLLELHDIYKIYKMGSEEVHANDGISINIYEGEFVAIVGKSGSGKSTLMNIIGALDVPTSGRYLIHGQDTSSMSDDELANIRNKKIGFIFQQYNLLPRDNLLDNVSLPLLYAGVPKAEQRERAMKQLERVGLADKWMQKPAQLSGGQQQRVSIARALAGDPELILADEPTGALDSKTSRQVLGFLKDINRDGNTVVMITHDNSIAMEAKRIVRISDGKVVYDGTAEDYAKLI
ncbi:ABC-type antimicrobial peptide transport system, ATPase component [Lachnospiraceae bacterium JC7]|nr:ABC-type antimicrobial peptide transport system, ATPase component [Lachnospiraceae bacterium JC7]